MRSVGSGGMPDFRLTREIENKTEKSGVIRAALFGIPAAILGQLLNALISTGYIFGFRKDNAIFFNGLGQNYPDRVSPKRLCH
jgi:hypothetical protein